MLAEWLDVKSLLVSRGLSAQYTVANTNYWIKAIDGAFELECILPTDTAVSSDSLDFVTNFKTNGNKVRIQETSVQAIPPFGAKTMVINGTTKNLYARFTGLQASVAAGTNVITYTASYNWAKLIGIEVINGAALDYADFEVYDTAAGTYSGHANLKLNQFSYSLNIGPEFYQKLAQFDADLYIGMVIKITYYSVGASTIGINLLLNEVK